MDRLWCAVQFENHCRYEPVDRALYMRSRPDTLARTSPTEALRKHVLSENVLVAVERALSKIRGDLNGASEMRQPRRTAVDQCTTLVCKTYLLQWCVPPKDLQEEKRTHWNSTGARPVLICASDGLAHQCTCAHGGKFDHYVSNDCAVAGMCCDHPDNLFHEG